MNLDQLRRVRWAVRATLLLGVAASVVANVLHAVDNPISQSIAAWPPLALLLTVELISRIPVHSRGLAVARILATAIIAGIAAWVSYWHMAGVAARYGETGASPYLLPVSVDGLIVVASICLVELGGRIRAAETPSTRPAVASGGHDPSRDAGTVAEGDASPAAMGDGTAVLSGRLDSTAAARGASPRAARDSSSTSPTDPARRLSGEPAARSAVRSPVRRRTQPRTLTVAERVATAHAKEPTATHKRLAELAGVSASSVKRHRPDGSPSGPDAAELIAAGGSREPAGVGS